MTSTTDIAPITLNGKPVATWRTATEIVLDGRLYFAEFAGSDDCSCRRCSLHEDFGGCIVAEACWGLVLWMSDPVGTFDEFADLVLDSLPDFVVR